MVKWYGTQFKAAIDKVQEKRMLAALIFYQNELRKALSRSQKTSGTGLKKRGLDPSAPGEYPKKVLGHLRRSVTYEFDRSIMTGRVGSNVKYGKFLQLGTHTMRPRPWLTNGLRDFGQEMKNILSHGRPL